MGFILATAAMLELERSVPPDRDPHLKRKTDVTNLLADPTKIKQLGWEPKKTIQDIIEDLIHYYLVPEHRKKCIVVDVTNTSPR
jgi:nucleoside-diphosphate-sugar epimerase